MSSALIPFRIPVRIRAIVCAGLLFALLSAVTPITLFAASVRGVVSDPTGGRVSGASVALVSNGAVVASSVSRSDGSFQMNTGSAGRFFLVVTANNFRQIQTPDFYAGVLDAVERNLVLEPAWVRESIVVSDTGTPTPEPQTSAATTVIGSLDLALQTGLIHALRLVPGAFVTQSGQYGAQSSLFVRGGNPDSNKILLDGGEVGDLGGQFDFTNLAATAIDSAEIYRGANSSLYGANAASGVVRLTTEHGTTHFPSLLLEADGGNLMTSHQRIQLSGARGKLDYLGAFNWLQTANDLPHDRYHLATSAANLGWQPNAATQIRGTIHYGVSAAGAPNSWDFYNLADNATQKDQDLYLSAAIDNQTTDKLHNSILYSLARKREQFHLWSTTGAYQSYSNYCWGPAWLGNTVTISGANGYTATGQAVLDCGTYQYQIVSNRDQLAYRGDVALTPHLTALVGFQYENERGAETYYSPVERNNYDYIAAVHGDFKNRFYYTLGGSLERYSLFGTQTSPRAGFSFFAIRPHPGKFSGTRVLFNYGDAVREPKLTEQDGSLYAFLANNGGQSTIQQLHVGQLAAPSTRTYEGGVEQSFLSQHFMMRVSYFHNQYGREIEAVGLNLVPQLLPNLTPAQKLQLESFLQLNYAYELYINSEAYRAQGIETSLESGIGKNLFLRGGYTYLDAVVQRSFTNDDQALLGPIPTFKNGLPIGPYSPLVGARPFRRPPHTGYFSAAWAGKKITAQLTSSFVGRSDDSTYLLGADAAGGNSLLLPNRNLDPGYADLAFGGSYKLFEWLTLQAQAENLLNNRHMAPIGFRSLPATIRTGMRIDWGFHGKR